MSGLMTLALGVAQLVARVPGAAALAAEVAHSESDAKPLAQSLSWWSLVFGAVAWTTHNVALWVGMEQSTETTLLWAVVGTIWLACSLIGILRRKGIRVPGWVAAVAEVIIADAPT